MRKRSSVVYCAMVIFCGCAATVMAQPAMSRGQQLLRINSAECLIRAGQALRAVGFSANGAGNFAQGFKDASGAYIICNDAVGGGTVVNIVVATIGDDAGVPGQLRQLLQAQMEQPNSAVPSANGCGLGVLWDEREEGWKAVWTRRGNSNVFDMRSSKGSMNLTALLSIDMNGNHISVRRTNASDGNNCQMEGTVAADGINVKGTYRCNNGGPYDWSAVIKCR